MDTTLQQALQTGHLLVKDLKLNEAVFLADESLLTCKTDEERSSFLNLKGEALLHAGHYSLASSCFFESLRLAAAHENAEIKAEACTGLSYVYRFLEDYRTAIEYADQSKSLLVGQPHAAYIKALISEGISNARLGNFEEAELILHKALQLSENIQDGYLAITCIKSQADLFLNRKEYVRAIQLYEKALALLREKEHFVVQTMTLVRFGEALDQSGHTEKAITVTQEALKLAGLHHFSAGERSAHYLLYSLFEKSAQTDKAFQHLKTYTHLKNSSEVSAQSRKIHKTELSFVKESKDKEIRLLKEIEEKHRSITQSISYARGLQQAILPLSELQNDPLLDYFVFFQPKEKVGGDFYRADKTDRGYLFCVSDCTGHGVPGAMLSLLCSNLVKQAHECTGLHEMLSAVNTDLHTIFGNRGNMLTANDGMDISLCAIEKDVDSATGFTLRFSGANHAGIIVRGEEVVQTAYNRTGISLLTPHDYHFTETAYPVRAGDCIYLFTDGYPDQFGGTTAESRAAGGKKFKYKQLIELLKSNSSKNILDQRTALQQSITSWMGDLEQVDDMCVLGIKFKG
ncbi:MAG: yrrB 5 [Bacteroidetes bacterium]|jgi:serine phosphatase RsbU (regulator of sigma subunit)|nr:yrrB 5 [Bacteroidota bacterium]